MFRRKRKPSDFGAEIEAHLQLETLGAQWKEALGAALGRAIKLLGFGSAAGLLLGILASRVLQSIVYQATSWSSAAWFSRCPCSD